MEQATPTLEELQQLIQMSNTINMEIFYWWCIALMMVIHAGFLSYEIGASRLKNALTAGVKNILAFAFIVPTFFFFGWWIYNGFSGGLIPDLDGAAGSLPWASSMGPNITDNATGIFWAAFVLFAATTASIMSGALIERTRMSAFIVLAIILGSGVWILGAAWSWHPTGWLTTKWGFHDVGAAGCVHAIAGFFTLGVVMNVGARIGRFNADGSSNNIVGHSMPMSVIGLMLVIVGFFGFLGGCIIYNAGGQWTNIYGQPTTLSAFAFNTLMGFSGGLIGAYLTTREPFWMMSGGLIGIVSVAPGLDVYYPPLAFVIGMGVAAAAPLVHKFLGKRGIDDAVGAFAVHGFGGFAGLVLSGIFIAGYPNVMEGAPPINFLGQTGGAIVLAALGFIPGYFISLLMKKMGVLRVPAHAEERGLDLVEVPAQAYPEWAITGASITTVSASEVIPNTIVGETKPA
ncbi:ammonium transporter [Pseudomonas taeanensis MS-3]|jgi:Amt family ammonium transporter|uniref:Ammonium transporter n=1 Tax=Pseudomonas taeanensis MS-3 TaxID=1395571 RepID=A0A0A1YQU4_9PSED|nr:ammonium transporter [Pseudomonas taeanensis]KFX71711.1 ammonium transporter [Pseudomonas taeanensis MS-3]